MFSPTHSNLTNQTTRPDEAGDAALISWVLRVGVVACFIGHGNLGLIRTAAWTSYFAVVGIPAPAATSLMPWVGLFDVALAFTILFIPIRGVMLYMAGWCVWTALLRPLAGEPFWEFVERAGNYGTPLALYFLAAGGAWARATFDAPLAGSQHRVVGWVLRLTTVLLLVGHGALNWFVHKPLFLSHYGVLGLPGASTETVVGIVECLLALAVLIKPDRYLLVGVVVWKLATEFLNPMAGSPIWVFIEHGGSYAAPLALALLQPRAHSESSRTSPAPAA